MKQIYSLDFLTNEYNPDIAVAYVAEGVFSQEVDALRCTRLFAAIFWASAPTSYMAVNLTRDREADEDAIYLPPWMIPGSVEIGERARVEFMSEEAFPHATKITLKPLDSAFYSSEIREELTYCLSRLGVVQKETIVTMKLETLDGFCMDFYISGCEPAGVVLCDGDEVAIEFEEAADQWDGRRTPPVNDTVNETIDHAAMIPEETKPEGQTLGGTVRPKGWNPWRKPTKI